MGVGGAVCASLILLLGHGRENLLHLVDDAVQLVWVPLDDFLHAVAHGRLTTEECAVSPRTTQQLAHNLAQSPHRPCRRRMCCRTAPPSAWASGRAQLCRCRRTRWRMRLRRGEASGARDPWKTAWRQRRAPCCCGMKRTTSIPTSRGGGEEQKLSTQRTHTSAASSPRVGHTATWTSWWRRLLATAGKGLKQTADEGGGGSGECGLLYLWAPQRRATSARGCQTEESTAAPARSRAQTPSGGRTARWAPRRTQKQNSEGQRGVSWTGRVRLTCLAFPRIRAWSSVISFLLVSVSQSFLLTWAAPIKKQLHIQTTLLKVVRDSHPPPDGALELSLCALNSRCVWTLQWITSPLALFNSRKALNVLFLNGFCKNVCVCDRECVYLLKFPHTCLAWQIMSNMSFLSVCCRFFFSSFFLCCRFIFSSSFASAFAAGWKAPFFSFLACGPAHTEAAANVSIKEAEEETPLLWLRVKTTTFKWYCI